MESIDAHLARRCFLGVNIVRSHAEYTEERGACPPSSCRSVRCRNDSQSWLAKEAPSIVSRMAYGGDDRAQGGRGSVFRYLWAVYAFIGQDHADLLRIAVPSLDQFGFPVRFRPGQVGDLARVVRDII